MVAHASPVVRPARRRFRLRARTVWLQAHLWIGLTLGLVTAVVGATGALLVLSGPMLRAEHSATVAPAPTTLGKGEWASIDLWIDKARARYPDLDAIEAVVAPDAAPVPTEIPILVGHRHGKDAAGRETFVGHEVVGVDPVSGEPLGRFLFEKSWAGTVLSLHTSLLLDEAGATLAAWSGLAALVVSIGTGLYLWWPRGEGWRAALTIKRGARGRRRLRDLHNVGAVWLLVPLALALLSGVYLLRANWFDPALRAVSELREPDIPALSAEKRPTCGGLTPGAALALAVARNPGWRLRVLTIPEAPAEPYYVGLMRPDGDPKVMATELWIDRSCPTVLFERNGESLTAAETVKSWAVRIHADFGLGVAGQALVAAAGLLLPTLWVTGVLLWVGRKRRRPTSPTPR